MDKTRLLIVVPASLLGLPLLLVLASRLRDQPSGLSPAGLPSAGAAAAPRAVVDAPTFDFGIMDPLTEGHHAFFIRNEGDAALQLGLGSTTCKCTLSRIPRGEIPPGEAGQVVLTWNTGRKDPYYEHGATVLTNDPLQAELQLAVKGTVRVQLGAAPAALVLSGVQPDRATETATVVYTQIGQPFVIEDASCSLAGAEVMVGDAPATALERLQAKCGYQLTLRLPGGLAHGAHQAVLQLSARRDGVQEAETLELPVSIEVLRRLAVYGQGIDMTGTVELGRLASGKGIRRRFVMKVRDEVPALSIRHVVTEPSWLQVEISPYRTATSTTGLYHLDIEVPPEAPECVYFGPRLGRIHLEIDHPRIPDLTLQVQLAVTRSDR